MSEKKPRRRKEVRIRPDLLQWVEEQKQKGTFWHLSHAIEAALIALRDSEKEN